MQRLIDIAGRWLGRRPRPGARSTSRRPSTRLSCEELESRLVPTGTMVYGGGPLLHNVEVVNVFLGQDWKGGSAAYGDYLYWNSVYMNNFAAHLVDSNFVDLMLANYGVGRGYLRGSTFVDDWWWNPGRTFYDQDVQNRLANSIWSGSVPWPDSNMLYVFYTEPNVTYGPGGDASYHGYMNFNGQLVPYAVIFWDPSWTWEAQTALTSHEIAEAVTDPVPGGWRDSDWPNGEIADQGGQRHLWDGYAIQSTWLNQGDLPGGNYYPASDGGNYVWYDSTPGLAPTAASVANRPAPGVAAWLAASEANNAGNALFPGLPGSNPRNAPFGSPLPTQTTGQSTGSVPPSGGSSGAVGHPEIYPGDTLSAKSQSAHTNAPLTGGRNTRGSAPADDAALDLVFGQLGQEQPDVAVRTDPVAAR